LTAEHYRASLTAPTFRPTSLPPGRRERMGDPLSYALDAVDIERLIPGAQPGPREIAVTLFGADGDLLGFFGRVAFALIAAAEHGLHVMTLH
jgi:hypothetical protein